MPIVTWMAAKWKIPDDKASHGNSPKPRRTTLSYMTRLNINLDRSPAELQTGLREIITQYPDRFGPADDARRLAASRPLP